MGRGQKEEQKNKVPLLSKVLGGQIGAGRSQGLTLKQMAGAGGEAIQANATKKIFAKGAFKAGLKGAGAGVAVVTAAHEGYKLGRKIKKKTENMHEKKLKSQQNEQSKSKARQAQIKYERGE